MQRSIISLLALVTLAACGSADGGVETHEAEALGTESYALEGCDVFVPYTGALGSRTVDCLGTVGPNTFLVDKNGYLRRNFEKCTVDEKALQDIDDLLGVQILSKEQPGGQQCIAGTWQTWQQSFLKSGMKECPVWKKTGVIGAPNARVIDAYAKEIPGLPAKEVGKDPRFLKENYRYDVRFPKGQPDQPCRDPADCGARCLGGLPGTFVSGQGEVAVLDPLYWLIGNDYPATNPFMRAGYYHPMSFWGALPGDLYGHRNREGEYCSRYFDGVHYPLMMELTCAYDADLSTCMSRCGSLEAAMAAAGVAPEEPADAP